MLGISAGRTLLFDSVEVGTDKTAQSTFVELNEKMKILTTAVIPVLKLRLQALQAQYARGFTSVNVPSDFVVRASPFRLKTFEMIMPLPVRVNKKGGTVTVDWVCYHPTTTWLPDGVTPAPGSGAPTGTDGMVIYHIHQSVLPELPKSIRDAIAKELNRWKQESGYVLELNPALTGAFVTEKSSWSPEARQLFAYFGVGALVLMFLAVGWELGVVAGGVALAEAGLTALAATPAALVGAIRVTAALASQCWPAAVGAAPLIPLGAR
jgi:hypothetical protein